MTKRKEEALTVNSEKKHSIGEGVKKKKHQVIKKRIVNAEKKLKSTPDDNPQKMKKKRQMKKKEQAVNSKEELVKPSSEVKNKNRQVNKNKKKRMNKSLVGFKPMAPGKVFSNYIDKETKIIRAEARETKIMKKKWKQLNKEKRKRIETGANPVDFKIMAPGEVYLRHIANDDPQRDIGSAAARNSLGMEQKCLQVMDGERKETVENGDTKLEASGEPSEESKRRFGFAAAARYAQRVKRTERELKLEAEVTAKFKTEFLKHSRGEGVDTKNIRHQVFKKRIENRERKIEFAADQAARSEFLLSEEAGYIEAGDYEETTDCTQKEIRDASDITSATKHFELGLEFGPYRLDYTTNGRHLLLGGERGHVAAFDWLTKQLLCEINVMESVHDVKWLHIETMFAVAQKSHLFIYDNQGTELHCIKQLHQLLRLEFLPYHFLLASSSESGHLAWLDVSVGKLVSKFNAKMGRLPHMTQNPYNATIALGHPTGVVTLWSPTVREPLAKLLCHKTAIQALHVDPTGRYLVSSAINSSVNIWDIRAMKPLQSYRMQGVPSTVKLSHKGCMALGTGNIIQVYRDCVLTPADTQYLTYKGNSGRVSDLQFCPFEDVVGAGTQRGFCSLIVPGCGEPNFDSLEQNPFRTKQQRREGEVKALLEKIQPELITLEPQDITEVDLPTLHDKLNAKSVLMAMRAPKVDYKPRRIHKRGGGLRASKAKKILQEEARKNFVATSKKRKPGDKLYAAEEEASEEISGPKSVLDRFKPKAKKKKAETLP